MYDLCFVFIKIKKGLKIMENFVNANLKGFHKLNDPYKDYWFSNLSYKSSFFGQVIYGYHRFLNLNVYERNSIIKGKNMFARARYVKAPKILDWLTKISNVVLDY